MTMSREEFILKYLDETFGHLAGAYFLDRAEGAELSVRLRAAFRKAQDMLGRIYGEFPQAAPLAAATPTVKR